MITKNKLDKSFGPVGSSAGIFMFIIGLVVVYSELTGLILVLIGAFMGFSSTCTLIDYDKKRIKFSNLIFGIIPIGQWIELKPDMKIGLKKIHKGYRTYSRSNRILDIHKKDIRIILFGNNNKKIMPINKFDSIDSANTELIKLSEELDLRII